MADPSDNNCVPLSQHAELIAKIHELDLELKHVLREIEDIKEEAGTFCKWMREDSQKSAWYYSVQHDLEELIESARWVKNTKRVIAWTVGALAGVLMIYQQVEIWVKAHK